MGCKSCAERAKALKESAKALKDGEVAKAMEPLKFVAQSGIRDARSALSQAADAARSRLTGAKR